MSDQLMTESVLAPAFYGLNTQEALVTTSNNFALVLENAIIDANGRVSARKGLQRINSLAYTDPIGCITESVSTTGLRKLLTVSFKKFYEGSSSNTLLFTHPNTPANNWQAANLNNHTYFFQRGEKPVLYVAATNTAELVETHVHTSGTVPKGNTALGAFGRLWVADTDVDRCTLHYSDTLIGHKWSGGSSGFIDLTTVFPNGGDEIVSLASFNNRLVIFARKSIIFYSGADDPTTMVVEDSLDELGCIARDSVVEIGNDIVFLSSSGLKSLSRVVQERSNPLGDLSLNVKDAFVNDILSQNTDNIRATYAEKDNFYLISLPSINRVWCFDTRQKLENGALRASVWTGFKAVSVFANTAGTIYIGESNNELVYYTGYNDRGSSYEFSYLSNHFSGGDTNITKILKKLTLLIVGGTEHMVVKVGTNFSSTTTDRIASIKADSESSQYNIAEFNVGKFNSSFSNQRIEMNIGGTGSVYQIGINATILNSPFSLQQMVIKFKKGKLF
jgi:hypothetical protein